MSLFERLNNKRYNLQEKKEFPGDKSGAYKAAKDDLEARKGFSKNKSGGLKADEKNPFVKTSVRKARVDKLGGDIYDQPKFSQKKFDKSIGGAKKPTTAAAPGSFGKGDTKGQMNVKAMDKKAFKVTQPSDIKKSKGFKPFAQLSKDIKDLKKGKRNISSMNPSEMERAFGTSSTEGSAGASGSSKTKAVKQSEVSKKAKDFTKNINQKRVSSSGYSQTNKPKSGSQVTVFKPKTSNTQVVGSTPFDKKGTFTKNITVPKKGQELQLPDVGKKVKSKVSPTTEYRRTVSKKYGIKPKNILSKTQKSILKQKRLAQKDVVKAAIGPQNRAFFKKAIALPGAKKAAPVIKALAKAGTVGRVAATVGAVAALTPAARKGMSSFAKRALTGAGLGGIVGGAAASQKETDKERIKKNLKPEFVKDKDGKEIKTVTRMGLNLSDISKPKKKDKGRTAQSIATEVDYLKKRQKVAPYGSKYTG